MMIEFFEKVWVFCEIEEEFYDDGKSFDDRVSNEMIIYDRKIEWEFCEE